nr:SDR family oxidoreductase [Flavisolibacter sp.]
MKNKIAIITGASSGIGKAIAHQLIEAGAIVVNADVHPPNHVAANNYYFIQTDLTLKEEVLHLFDEVAKLGVPHILICNAGKGVHEKLAEGDPEKWQSVININLMGTLRFLRAFLPSMVKKGNGDIIFISSVAANQAYAFGGIYAASKAAMDAIAATLRLELENNIRVSTIAPGVVD